MGIFGRRDEHHETPCPARDDGGPSWIRRDQSGKPNPMGWGSNAARVVRAAGGSARGQQRPTMHGSGAEWNLMSGMGSATDWGRDGDPNVHVTGEKPGGGKQR